MDLRGRHCVVTGASSGIGRAVTVKLATAGATVYAIARNRGELEATAQLAQPGTVVPFAADLTREDGLLELAHTVSARDGGIDVLVHSAGTWSYGRFDTAAVAELDRQYATNVRAPYMLTQALLPALRASAGQVVFINSTAGLAARAGVAQYAATKHALKALADALREEVNSEGIRVLTVYPGRTASPLQARIFAVEGRPYVPERLMQPEDVASTVLHAITLPRTAEITDLTVRQMLKA